MKCRLEQLAMPLEYENREIPAAAAEMLGLEASMVKAFQIIRRSIDARPRRGQPVYILIVDLELAGVFDVASCRPKGGGVVKPAPDAMLEVRPDKASGKRKVIVVGAGPAGLLAALELAEAGWAPLLVDRGQAVETRAKDVAAFWRDGILNEESNALYGEGGAGTFSDGKLTARSKDRVRMRRLFQALVDCGADPSILIDAEPHLGSDRLRGIVAALRERILTFGGEVRFGTRLVGFQSNNGMLRGVTLENREAGTQVAEACDACVLATGHSARDVYSLLHREGVPLTVKPFGVGVRVQLPQIEIDRAQYGTFAGHPRLGAASFRLTRKGGGKVRNCYTFCMCPGGEVIACSSEAGCLTTNGMSNAARSGKFGNAAFLVPVGAEDFTDGTGSVLAGMDFQRAMEASAYRLGGEDYSVPACSLSDFLGRVDPGALPLQGFLPRSVPVNLHDILPECITHTLAESIPAMIKTLRGVTPEEVVLYGPETRSSAPVRILRDESLQSTGLRGLYPAGEGAGTAGGIVSSALDGMRVAEAILTATGV